MLDWTFLLRICVLAMAKVGDKEASRHAYQESLVPDSTLTQYTSGPAEKNALACEGANKPMHAI